MSTPHLFLVLLVSFLICTYAVFDRRWNWMIVALLLVFMSGAALVVRFFSLI
jgi:hypothetical protein